MSETLIENRSVVVNAAVLARAISLPRKTIAALIRRGMPTVRTEPTPRFDLMTCVNWWNERKEHLIGQHGKLAMVTAKSPVQDIALPGVIYAIVHKPSGSVHYIGKASDFADRRRHHIGQLCTGTHKNTRLQRWFTDEGVTREDLEVVIIERCGDDTINDRETFWIGHGRSRGWPLKNVADGANGCVTHSTTTRRKLSTTTAAKFADPEYVKRWEESQAKRWGRPVRHRTKQQKAWQARARQQAVEARRVQIEAKRAAEAEARKPLPIVPLTIKSETAVLPLTQGRYAILDAKDWPLVAGFRWYANARHDGRMRARRCSADKTMLHVVILGRGATFKSPNYLDCRRRNLLQ